MDGPRFILGIVLLVLASAYKLTPHGVIVNVTSDKSIVELAVEGLTSFRVSVAYGRSPVANESPMIEQHIVYSKFSVTHDGSTVGVKTSFGEIQLNSQTGAFKMVDANGKTITSTDKLSEKLSSHSEPLNDDTCLNFLKEYDMTSGERTPSCPDGLAGQTQQSCCTACNKDADCTVWIFATDGGSEGKNCWLMKKVQGVRTAGSRVIGGGIPMPPVSIKLTLGRSSTSLFYGRGCSRGDSKTLPKTSSDPGVHNTAFNTPYYYSSDGYSALGVSPHSYSSRGLNMYPAGWSTTTTTKDVNGVSWTIEGNTVDLYLMPASTQAAGLSAYWDLTGRPAVLPRYAYGFLACRWGWVDDKYIWDMLSRFRNESFPLDAWISDFEWYTPHPDYSLPDTGAADFKDFSYNNKTFPKPIDQLKSYREELHLRFGGIRKPRLGNSDLLVMAKKNHWTVDSINGDMPTGVNARNLNYTRADVRDWYQKQQAHYLTDGVEFWWNDEGEAFYFMFYWWNMAEIDTLTNYDPNKRFFTINRAYTPGMQRFGASTWTGDISSNFGTLQGQPGYVLNWNLAGSMYVTCDTGGFNGPTPSPLLLTRWYQFAVFMPIMRVHSTNGQTPHFPFLFGSEAAGAMRKALNIRYRLIPYHYSLAHQGYNDGGKPIMRPLLWEYGSDETAAKLTSQWMDGDYLMPAPVLQQDNSTTVYLPAGEWYEFNTTSTLKGPQTLHLTTVPLDHIPVYVKSGGVIPLGPVIQYSDQLPGGPLEVQIYPGKDGSFLMFEDDGKSKDYQKGISKRTHFLWNDASKTLSWSSQGSFKDDHIFAQIYAVAFFPKGEKKSSTQSLSATGKISF